MKKFSLPAILVAALAFAPDAKAQVFEVIHPDVEKDQFELEALNGLVLSDVANGEERYVLELAAAYSPVSFWKTTFAVEIAKP